MGGGGGFAYFEDFYSLKTALSSAPTITRKEIPKWEISASQACVSG